MNCSTHELPDDVVDQVGKWKPKANTDQGEAGISSSSTSNIAAEDAEDVEDAIFNLNM